ncbi:MAG: methionine gamma-lyase family protein [Candidatus Eremiobacteraeota bacterium]|nr:methionine gamma-lyase family protein [Candidatus Eremiobacteraeota bacterium]MBV8366394.1 methionine gamma-lyase family protein [Candidatus Eremiobacteraeota bacterium]
MKAAQSSLGAALATAAERFELPASVIDAGVHALEQVQPAWRAREALGLEVGAKVVAAFARAGIDESHLAGSTGYAYHDRGREAYEALLAGLMDAPAALARLQLVSGTHAIVAALRSLLPSGGTLCSITGAPYDTLRMAIADHPSSLVHAHGVRYSEAVWNGGIAPRDEDVMDALRRVPDVVFVQRSRGYAPRPSLSVAQIERLVELVRAHAPGAIVLVDNCYGELVEQREPTAGGADLVVGSLIKNLGGGLATSGAYVAGRADLIARIADGVFAPGLGSAVGPTLDTARWCFAGLHRAAHAVVESLKTLDFAAALFAALGFGVDPQAGAPRSDIIQALKLGSSARISGFTRGLQRMLPVNARALPEPGPVPGYADPVIMAGGAFISGSTLELSSDAPLREPYDVYLQGGLDVTHGMLALMSAAAGVLA